MTFKEKVIKLIQAVPYGKVASYSQIALLAGSPRAARQVGSILNHIEHEAELPWWRVVNNTGRISIKGSDYSPIDQKLRLEAEGLAINVDLTFEIEKYRWSPPQHLYSL
jgi:methylated-DNA-protein-cysteine methyltransferase-like protein